MASACLCARVLVDIERTLELELGRLFARGPAPERFAERCTVRAHQFGEVELGAALEIVV